MTLGEQMTFVLSFLLLVFIGILGVARGKGKKLEITVLELFLTIVMSALVATMIGEL